MGNIEEKTKVEDELKDAPVDDTEDTSTEDSSDADPELETDLSDTEADPAETIDEYQKKFKELGLDKQFTDPLDVLDRVRDFNVHTDHLHKRNLTLERENADLRKPKVKPPDTEKLREMFDEDPLAGLRQAGVATKDDVSAIKTEIDEFKKREHLRNFADSMVDIPELKNIAAGYRIGREPVRGINPYWDKMNEILKADYPGLETADPAAIVQILLPEAKKLVDPRKKPPVDKVSDEDKSGANTSSPKKSRSDGIPNYAGMTSEQIKADYRKRNMVNEH